MSPSPHLLTAAIDRALATGALPPLALGEDQPGGAWGLSVDGQVVHQQVQGMADLNAGTPLSPDSRFYMASESKVWTAWLVWQVMGEQGVPLDHDVRAELPWLSAYDTPITLGQLLRHTAGVPDYLFLWSCQLGHHENDLVSQDTALALIQRAGSTDHPPGERHAYSNSHYVLLAEWLRVRTGHDLAALSQSRLWDPWGLRRTGFCADPWAVMPGKVRSYERTPDATGTAWRESAVNLGSWGDGGLWMSLSDALTAECQLMGPEARKPHALSPLVAVANASGDDPAGGYGLGLERVTWQGTEAWFHGGAYAGFASLCLRVPGQRWALVHLSQREGGAWRASAVLGALEGVAAGMR